MTTLKKLPLNWRRISLSTDGKVYVVRYSQLSPTDLMNLFYAALENIPHAEIALTLALEKHQKNKAHE